MAGSETSREISEKPSAIVRIAYHQLSVMCGTRDPTAPASAAATNADDADLNRMVCTRRLLGLPLFATMTSAFCGAYATVRGSHESVATILGHAEDGMRAGLDLASPVTGRVADLLETPLKVVDNAVCVGLDFLEETMPSVKLPPGQIYTNMKDSVSGNSECSPLDVANASKHLLDKSEERVRRENIFTSALETLRLLFGGPKDRIEDLSVTSETAQQGIRKVSS